MTWNLHIPVTAEKKHAERIDTGVKIGVNCFGRNSKTYRTLISISTEVAERVFKVRDQQAFNVRIYMGAGDDKGKIRLVECKLMDEGSVRVTFNKAGKKGWYKVQLGEVAAFPSWPQSMRMCKIHHEQDEVVILTLPEWEAQPLTPREAVNRKPQVGPGTAPLPAAVKPVPTTEAPLKPMLPVATNRRELDAAAAKAKALVPAPDFSGKHKPTRKELLAKIGNMRGGD